MEFVCLKVTSAAELDYEKQIKHEITIRVTDSGEPNPLHYDKVFIVTVTDVNEPVSSVRLSNNKVSMVRKLDFQKSIFCKFFL